VIHLYEPDGGVARWTSTLIMENLPKNLTIKSSRKHI
jgi:hypothetical protein